MDSNAHRRLVERARQLGHGILDARLKHELNLFEATGCPSLEELVRRRLDHLESELLMCPFLSPTSSLNLGKCIVGHAAGRPVSVSVGSGVTGFQHCLVSGQTGTGKTFFLARFASSLAASADVVLIDSQGQFSRFPVVRQRFAFAPIRALRINPFDLVPGLSVEEQDLLKVQSMAACFSWQLAQQEVGVAVRELRERESVSLPELHTLLATKKYAPNSNRRRFADTAILTLGHLLTGTHPFFLAKQGMDLRAVLTQGAVVLDLSSLLIEHQRYVLRMLFDFIYQLRRSGTRLERPLVFLVDEAQGLLQDSSVADQLLTLRHSRLHLVAAVQNPSAVCKEVVNNCDLFLAFRLIDSRDRRQISEAMNLDREQADYLAILDERQVVCFMPHSTVKQAFLLQLPMVAADPPGCQVGVRGLEANLNWTPLDEDRLDGRAKDNGIDDATERFLRDVLIQEHEASSLTSRFERAGVRSASKQGQIIRWLCSEGYIKVHSLAVGRGRPLKLVEPTDKALSEYGVTWKKTRGALPTRVATRLLERKFGKLVGWTCIPEGSVRGEGEVSKQVDLLLRDPDNRVVTLEVAGLSGKHEGYNALACLSCREVRKHLVVSLTKKVLSDVKAKFAGIEELAGEPRIELVLLSKALKEDWVP